MKKIVIIFSLLFGTQLFAGEVLLASEVTIAIENALKIATKLETDTVYNITLKYQKALMKNIHQALLYDSYNKMVQEMVINQTDESLKALGRASNLNVGSIDDLLKKTDLNKSQIRNKFYFDFADLIDKQNFNFPKVVHETVNDYLKQHKQVIIDVIVKHNNGEKSIFTEGLVQSTTHILENVKLSKTSTQTLIRLGKPTLKATLKTLLDNKNFWRFLPQFLKIIVR